MEIRSNSRIDEHAVNIIRVDLRIAIPRNAIRAYRTRQCAFNRFRLFILRSLI